MGAITIADVGYSQIDSHRFLLVRVTSSDGQVGYGEGSGLTGATAWIDRFRPLLIGQHPFDVQRLVTQLLWGRQAGTMLTYGEEQDHPVDAWLVRYGAAGASLDHAATRAVSAIEMALLDLVGKVLGTPVYNLLGGRYRDRIPIYLDLAGVQSQDPAAWLAYGATARGLGFRAVKCDADLLGAMPGRDPWNRALPRAELARTVELLSAFREGLGRDIDLAVDCHGVYNAIDAERLARALEPLDLMWLEDLLPDFNPGDLAEIRRSTSTPIAVGELMQTLLEHRPFIDAHAMDILHPDPRMVGGLLEYRRVADYADAHYIPTAVHNGASPYGTVAAAHGCAATRSFLALEYHWSSVRWISDLVVGGLAIEDGCLVLSDRPGFGIEIDENAWAARAGRR